MSDQVHSHFDGVRFFCKANVYFDGKVVSHAFEFPDGTRKSAGLIYPGAYTFTTEAAERMDIISGTCRAKLAGEADSTAYGPGTFFEVPAQSSFEIAVDSGIAEYVCSYK